MSAGRIPPDGLAEFVRRLPKAELHLHLEGAIRPGRLLRLAAKRGVSLPADDEDGVRRWFRFRDFEEFVEIYVLCSSCLRDPEDFQEVAGDLLEEQARQNVLHSEAHFTISTHLAHGVNGDEVAHALAETLAEGQRDLGVTLRLIPDIVRNLEPARADRTLQWALDHRRRGVVALGIAGFERADAAAFRQHFQVAVEEGLHRVAHAGETAGPESIRWVLDELHAERIGHGVRSVEDPRLVEELVERQVPLEICPTSNVRLGVAPDFESHPIGALHSKGVALTINTDDPGFFDTTLCEEYLRVADTFELTPHDLATIAFRSFGQAFLSQEERRSLEAKFRQGLAEASEACLGESVRL